MASVLLMHEAWTHELETWHEFYLFVGTAGVTLTGLLFVVVSLGPRVVARHQTTGVRAYISPNAVYFTTTLVVSTVLMIPSLPASLNHDALGRRRAPLPFRPPVSFIR